jgi:predicted nucleotide-binding protein
MWRATDQIPNNVIATVGEVIGNLYSHTRINTLFMESSFPGDAPAGNCIDKSQSWIRAANNVRDRRPLDALADLLGNLQIRLPEDHPESSEQWNRIHAALAKAGLAFDGSAITTVAAEPRRSTATAPPVRSVINGQRPVQLVGPHDVSESTEVQKSSTSVSMPSKDVFIAHGHDNALKNAVARFATALGLNPIILHEQPDHGETIIAKLESRRSPGFAVVLFTGDDLGCKSDESDERRRLRPRARQNVVLELGFFLGCLGRAQVCSIVDDGVEVPSDMDGVLFAPKAEWQAKLYDRLCSSGYRFEQAQTRLAMAIR